MKALLFPPIFLALLFSLSVRTDTVTDLKERDSNIITMDEGNVDSALLPTSPTFNPACSCAINQGRESCFFNVPKNYVISGCCGSQLSFTAPADVRSKVDACLKASGILY